jgi:hypothetical protein
MTLRKGMVVCCFGSIAVPFNLLLMLMESIKKSAFAVVNY